MIITRAIKEIFSGANGKLSAKRVIGGVGMGVALGCTIYLAIRDGSNEVVENLLTTILILSASLLGLPAITGVFGKSSITSFKEPIKEDDIKKEELKDNKKSEEDHCKNCIYNKKDL